MNAGVPLLNALLDDVPFAEKHRFQSIRVPHRSSDVGFPVSLLPGTGTNMFSMEISIKKIYY